MAVLIHTDKVRQQSWDIRTKEDSVRLCVCVCTHLCVCVCVYVIISWVFCCLFKFRTKLETLMCVRVCWTRWKKQQARLWPTCPVIRCSIEHGWVKYVSLKNNNQYFPPVLGALCFCGWLPHRKMERMHVNTKFYQRKWEQRKRKGDAQTDRGFLTA